LPSACNLPENVTKPWKKSRFEKSADRRVDLQIFQKLFLFRGFAAISGKLQALGLPPQICAPQIPWLRNSGKRMPNGRELRVTRGSIGAKNPLPPRAREEQYSR